jgi:uncharacterized protein YukE
MTAAINTALGVLENVHQEIRNAENDLAAFDQLHGEVASLEQLVHGAQERQRELNAEPARLKELSGWFERGRKLNSDIGPLSADLDQLQLSRSQLRPDIPLLQVADDIRSLLKGRDHTAALRKQKPEVQQTIETLRRDLAESIATLGPEWAQDRIETFVPPVAAVDEIAAQEVELREVELQLAEARATERTRTEEQKVAFEAEKQVSAEFESAPTPLPAPDVVLFERLVSGRGDYERTTRDLRAREGEIRAAEDEFRRSLGEINPRWTEEDLQGFDTSLPARQEVERFRDRLAEAAKALERTGEQVAQAEAAARNSEERRRQALEKYASAPQAPCDDPAFLVEWREIHSNLALRWGVTRRAPSPRWLPQAVAFAGVLSRDASRAGTRGTVFSSW